MGERRETKKRQTRQRISDVATKLFVTRGFDAVTLDDVAAAAKVSKMTVFNYFARKEDLMLDRLDDLKLVVFRDALRARPAAQAPVATLRLAIDTLRAQKHPFSLVHPHSVDWWRTVAASPSLQARLRELYDEAAADLALELARPAPNPDGLTRLTAGLIVLTVATARREAVRLLERGGSAKRANAAFFALLEHGLTAVEALPAARA